MRRWVLPAGIVVLLGTLVGAGVVAARPPRTVWCAGDVYAEPRADARVLGRFVRMDFGDEYQWHVHVTEPPPKWRQLLVRFLGPPGSDGPDCLGHYRPTGRSVDGYSEYELR